ncbi:MAG: GHKL domain-containing protein [Deltaproteobacteria bacterium]|nr:GHKL domain-containing protein [Deltaproteobacteria bacterium]
MQGRGGKNSNEHDAQTVISDTEHSYKARPGLRIVSAVMFMVAAVTAVSVFAYWRLDRVQQNVEAVNRFYVPALKHLNLIGGKWATYQRAFEQSISFRTWGDRRRGPVLPKIHLRRIVDGNIFELMRVLDRGPGAFAAPGAMLRAEAEQALAVRERLRRWLGRLTGCAEGEPQAVAELVGFVKARHFSEAAAAYTRIRQHHLEITQELAGLSAGIENGLSSLQLSTEQELRRSQTTVFGLLALSLLFSLVVLFRLRRWFQPVFEWTRVAREIALKGIHAGVRFPRVTRATPSELALLTREFTRMARTVLERELTIRQQKDKLGSLNETLRVQNGRLIQMAEAEKKLAHARKLVLAGNMSSQIAHEVRNPLNSISLQLEMLLEDLDALRNESAREAAEASARKRIAAVTEQVERLDRITRGYLEVGKPVAAAGGKVDLHALIENCISFLAREIQAAGVTVNVDPAENSAEVAGDADALSQVLFNLIRNAIEAMAEAPADSRTLRIVTRRKGGEIRVAVRDGGSGVRASARERLFEPFMTTKTTGHGLGLCVSRQICIDHGGDLRLVEGGGAQGTESAQGACFEIALPRVREGGAPLA